MNTCDFTHLIFNEDDKSICWKIKVSSTNALVRLDVHMQMNKI